MMRGYSGRMAAEGSDFYLRAAVSDVDDTITPGGSGYFSAPSDHLDPRLFSGTHFLPSMRSWVLHTLYSYWATKYSAPQKWSVVWAAGSGISYQWDADRGNGDLDILIGVDFPKFWMHNRDYVGFSEEEMADQFNQQFHAELWPKTANWNGFEVTFYVNNNATDIRDINPYAAYNLTTDEWTVKPPVIGSNPRSEHPKEYWDAVKREIDSAKDIIVKFNEARAKSLHMTVQGSPGWHNAIAETRYYSQQAASLFDSIHTGRRAAFGPGGSGYGDYYNFRWQAHKDAGTGPALHAIAAASEDAVAAQQVDLYGRRLATASEVRSQAVLQALRARS